MRFEPVLIKEEKIMRKLFITARLVLISLLATASRQSSQLSVSVSQNQIIRMSIDQGPLSAPGKSVLIDCIKPGYHFISVVGYSRSNDYYQSEESIFSNYVYIPSSSIITAVIDCKNNFIVSNLAPFHHRINRLDIQDLYKRPDFFCKEEQIFPMCEIDFERLKCSVISKNFEHSKLQIARQAIASNHVTTKQVSELMQLLTFESSRLELAEQAYEHTIDKQNYYQVNDSFTFESSISELNHFIQRS